MRRFFLTASRNQTYKRLAFTSKRLAFTSPTATGMAHREEGVVVCRRQLLPMMGRAVTASLLFLCAIAARPGGTAMASNSGPPWSPTPGQTSQDSLAVFTFVRETGKPNPATASFSASPGTRCTLRVYNGGRQGEFERVSSAMIQLNDAQIIGPSDFNQQVELTRAVGNPPVF